MSTRKNAGTRTHVHQTRGEWTRACTQKYRETLNENSPMRRGGQTHAESADQTQMRVRKKVGEIDSARMQFATSWEGESMGEKIY